MHVNPSSKKKLTSLVCYSRLLSHCYLYSHLMVIREILSTCNFVQYESVPRKMSYPPSFLNPSGTNVISIYTGTLHISYMIPLLSFLPDFWNIFSLKADIYASKLMMDLYIPSFPPANIENLYLKAKQNWYCLYVITDCSATVNCITFWW